MIDTTKKQHNKKMLVIGLAAGMLIAAPLGYRAYANEGTIEQVKEQAPAVVVAPQETTATVDASVEQAATVATDKTTVAAVDAAAQTQVTTTTTTPEEEVVPVEPNEEDTTTPAVVADLQTAIGIAVAEHGDAKVVSARVKTLGAETVYKVTFEDGFAVYVSADDGEVLILKDKTGKHHKVNNHAKQAWMKKHNMWDMRSQELRAWATQWLEQHPWFAEQLRKLLELWQQVQQTDPAGAVAPVESTQPAVNANVNAEARAEAKKDKTRSQGRDYYSHYAQRYQNVWNRH